MAELNADQQKFFDALCNTPRGEWLILKAPAGYGKTFALAKALKTFQTQGVKMLACAPTHQAVRVMKQFAKENNLYRLDIKTIDSALKLQPNRAKDGSKVSKDVGGGNLSKYELIWVDEASMIDGFKWQKLKEKVAPQTIVVFTCDHAQFAPVSPKEQMLFSPVITGISERNHFTLTQPMRSHGYVFEQINKLRNNVLTSIDGYLAGEPLPIPDGNLNIFESVKDKCIVRRDPAVVKALLVKCLAEGQAAKIIAYKNDTVAEYNTEIRAMIKGDLPEFVEGDVLIARTAIAVADDLIPTRSAINVLSAEKQEMTVHFDGEPVPLMRWVLNVEVDGANYELMPVAKEDFPKAVHYLNAVFQKLGSGINARMFGELCTSLLIEDVDKYKATVLSKTFRPMLSYSYAITAHQSQGSTYDCSIVLTKDMQSILRHGDDRLKVIDYWRSLYVAASRTSNILFLNV